MSDEWYIQPNGPLIGDVEVYGSKNAVTKHMVAAILNLGMTIEQLEASYNQFVQHLAYVEYPQQFQMLH